MIHIDEPARANWTEHEELIVCALKDGTPRTVKVKYQTSDTGIIDLTSVDTGGFPRENFDSLKTDIGEHFRIGYANPPYKSYQGLFNNELQ